MLALCLLLIPVAFAISIHSSAAEPLGCARISLNETEPPTPTVFRDHGASVFAAQRSFSTCGEGSFVVVVVPVVVVVVPVVVVVVSVDVLEEEATEDILRLGGVTQDAPHAQSMARMARGRLPWLADHRLRGLVVFPGAGYLEMMLAAGEEQAGAAVELRGAAFVEPLVLVGEAAVSVQVVAGAGRVQVASGGTDGWIVHATATLAPAGPLAPLDLAGARERLAAAEPGHQVIAALAGRGLEYGPAFHGLAELRRGDGEALARVELPEAAGSDAGYRLHPALLDACTLDVALLRRDDAAFSFRGVPDPRASFRPAHTRVDFEASVLGLFTDPLAPNPLLPPIQRAPGVQPWPATRFFGPFTARDQPADAPLALFNDLPPHDQLELSFDLLVLGDWRGDAVLEVRSLGRVLSRATYSTGDAHQSFPGAPPQADYPGGTAALARDVLGLGGRDAVFRHHLVFPHSDPTLIVQWLAHGVGGDNRWGIDNVELVTRTYSGHREPVEVVAGVMTTLEHGPPLPPEQAGCADGTRESFTDRTRFPLIAGCSGATMPPCSPAAARNSSPIPPRAISRRNTNFPKPLGNSSRGVAASSCTPTARCTRCRRGGRSPRRPPRPRPAPRSRAAASPNLAPGSPARSSPAPRPRPAPPRPRPSERPRRAPRRPGHRPPPHRPRAAPPRPPRTPNCGGTAGCRHPTARRP